MRPDTATFDLPELIARAGVSARTVRYYIQQGLLPAPQSRGPGAHYSHEHLHRLYLIRRLQREHLPLAEIRRRLDELTPDDIRRLATEPAEHVGERSDARDYIRGLLSEDLATISLREQVPLPLQTHTDRAARGAPPLASSVSPIEPSHAGLSKKHRHPKGADTPGQRRSRWDRIELAPDVELHVRRPLTREQNRQLEELLDAARTILTEDPT